MANTDNPNGFKWVKTIGSNTPYVDYVTLGGTVTAGDALVFSAGACTIALSNSGLIHGVAAESGVSSDVIMFYPAIPQNVFEAQCSGTYSAASHLGAAVDLEGTTGIQEVNEDSANEDVCKIMELKPGSEEGANSRVYVTFPRSSYTELEDAQ